MVCAQFEWWNSSIWYIDRTLLGAATPGQSGPGGDGNERVLRITQSSSITGAWTPDWLMLYPGHLFKLGEFYPSAEIQSVYFTAPADWAVLYSVIKNRKAKIERNNGQFLNLYDIGN